MCTPLDHALNAVTELMDGKYVYIKISFSENIKAYVKESCCDL